MLNAKYTDQDVRTHPDLIEIAHQFLRRYQGDWEFLVQCKNHLEAHNHLPMPTVRAVLNAMRANPEGAMFLPQTPTGRFSADGRVGLGQPPMQTFLKAVPARPVYIVVNTTWKMPYLLSTHKIAQVYHVLRPEYCELRWYTQLGVFVPKLHVWCGKYIYNATTGAYVMSYSEQGRRICAGCRRVMMEYDERTNAV